MAATHELSSIEVVRVQEAKRDYVASGYLDARELSVPELEAVFKRTSLLEGVKTLIDQIPGPVSGFRIHD